VDGVDGEDVAEGGGGAADEEDGFEVEGADVGNESVGFSGWLIFFFFFRCDSCCYRWSPAAVSSICACLHRAVKYIQQPQVCFISSPSY
jgi:hypothetical protein